MLNTREMELLGLLRQFTVMRLTDCRSFAGKNGTGALLRLKYISEHGGMVTLLSKGRDLVGALPVLMVVGGNVKARDKAARTAGVAALFLQNGIPSVGRMPFENENAFVPSTIWRRFRTCILSTSRFDGILFYNNQRIVVYDIGDGAFEWQSYAEYSHFFWQHGEQKTHADAMLLVCQDGMGLSAATAIVRHTLWRSDQFLNIYRNVRQDTKPHKYSRLPVTVRHEYGCAMLAERSEVMDILREYAMRDLCMEWFFRRQGMDIPMLLFQTGKPQYEMETGCKLERLYFNPFNDLILYASCIAEARMCPSVSYRVAAPPKYASLPGIFCPSILPMKGDVLKQYTQ